MNIDCAVELLELLSDKSRLSIIKALLKQRRMIGNELLKEVHCTQSTLSHHMNVMVNAKLINSRKNGNKMIYSLNYETYYSLINYLGKTSNMEKLTPPKKIKSTISQVEDLIQEEYIDNNSNTDNEKTLEDVPVYLL